MQKKAIVLGGIVAHIPLIENLKRRGYYTILVDYFENPAAAIAADEHIRESALDKEIVLKIAEERQIDLIICSSLDQQIPIAMYVAEKLNLPHPFSYQTSLEVTNKKYMKKKMIESHIPTSKYVHYRSESDLEYVKNLEYPLIVKPTDSNGAAGVRKVYSPEELESCLKDALAWSRTKEVIIEEFKSGIELSVYSYVKNGEAHQILTSRRFSKIDQEDGNFKCFASIAPFDVSPKALENMKKISNQIAKEFGLINTPLFYQSIVNGDDVSVIEFAPRLGGGMCFRTMELNCHFDMINASVCSYLGEDVEMNNTEPEYYYLTHQIYGLPGIYDHVDNYQELLDENAIDEIYFHKTPGMEVTESKASSSRIAAILIKSKEINELLSKIANAMQVFDVKDIHNQSIMKRNYYLKYEDVINMGID